VINEVYWTKDGHWKRQKIDTMTQRYCMLLKRNKSLNAARHGDYSNEFWDKRAINNLNISQFEAREFGQTTNCLVGSLHSLDRRLKSGYIQPCWFMLATWFSRNHRIHTFLCFNTCIHCVFIVLVDVALFMIVCVFLQYKTTQ